MGSNSSHKENDITSSVLSQLHPSYHNQEFKRIPLSFMEYYYLKYYTKYLSKYYL